MRKKAFVLPVLLTFAILLHQGNIYAEYSQIVYLRSSDPVIQTGQASWYSRQDPGINLYTANHEVFDDSGLTAAMWDVPFNQLVRVTNLENGKFVIVRVNDRGPHRRLVETGRIIDLTKYAFSRIASLEEGLIRIQIELL
ncbi:MAG: septal ring lytic transglycosylase RlpA family lipoprotein [Candidatus Omnitrophica bacterium]|nr:septal ring lytic transglycosylase RlpA family lipoprotein [Candidatus Omnitrophota bacterium]